MSKTYMITLVMLAVAGIAFSQPEWTLNITLQKGTTFIPLAIGGATTATDGFDVAFDVLSPPPSTTDYFACLEIVDPLFAMVTQDVRGWISPYSTAIEWKIVIMK